MTPIQIAYFKHFLFDRGIQAVYISMYRKKRLKGSEEDGVPSNPESLEQFLQEQPYFRVFMKAFYFDDSSNFGYEYWKEIDKKWKKYLELNSDNPQNDKVVVLKGSFGILRQNWDKPQYWKTESMGATYTRMKMEPPLKDVDLETAFGIPRSASLTEDIVPEHKFKVGDSIRSRISEEVLTVTAIKPEGYEVSDDGFVDFEMEKYWDKEEKTAQEGSNNSALRDSRLEKLTVLDYSTASIDIYFVDSETKVDDAYIEKLGYNINTCYWMFSKDVNINFHKEILK